MASVFMPTNLQMYELILNKADLLIEPVMPDCLLKLTAHVTAYKTIMAMWEKGDFSKHEPLIGYPSPAINEYALDSFQHLMAKQKKLLGKR
jgi:hypothetical protein